MHSKWSASVASNRSLEGYAALSRRPSQWARKQVLVEDAHCHRWRGKSPPHESCRSPEMMLKQDFFSFLGKEPEDFTFKALSVGPCQWYWKRKRVFDSATQATNVWLTSGSTLICTTKKYYLRNHLWELGDDKVFPSSFLLLICLLYANICLLPDVLIVVGLHHRCRGTQTDRELVFVKQTHFWELIFILLCGAPQLSPPSLWSHICMHTKRHTSGCSDDCLIFPSECH